MYHQSVSTSKSKPRATRRRPRATLRLSGSDSGGSRPPSRNPLETLPALGPSPLEDLGEIARGGFGTVHRVYDRVLLRHAAQKVLRSEAGPESDEARRFLVEAQITAQLDHPNIVPVHDFGTDAEGHWCFTMKLVQGRTLADILAEQDYEVTPEDLEKALRVILRACDAVAFAHSRGVIHRDLKPANIMVGGFGQVYVMDWGIAKLQTQSESVESLLSRGKVAPLVQVTDPEILNDRPGTVVGTVAYMASEQALGHFAAIDERTDVFALGAMIYHALTGSPPYLGFNPTAQIEEAAQGAIELPTIRTTRSCLPPRLCEITMKAVACDPADRHQSVEALQSDLEQFLRGPWWFPVEAFIAGDVIVREGEKADAAYIITEGQCEALKATQQGDMVLRVMGPGDMFGEAAIFADRPRSATVRALGRVVVTKVTRESLEKELHLRSWQGAFVKTLADRFRELDARLNAPG